MPAANHINPDHFLHATDGPASDPQRARDAWEQAYAELARQLDAIGPSGTLYLVCGLQGAGKSTWVARNAHAFCEPVVFFDAALPSRKHRSRALGLAARSGTPAVAVWLNAPVQLALERNARRPDRERVPEHIIHHVLEQLEPPSPGEGFVHVMEVGA
jgi:predicted kinase